MGIRRPYPHIWRARVLAGPPPPPPPTTAAPPAWELAAGSDADPDAASRNPGAHPHAADAQRVSLAPEQALEHGAAAPAEWDAHATERRVWPRRRPHAVPGLDRASGMASRPENEPGLGGNGPVAGPVRQQRPARARPRTGAGAIAPPLRGGAGGGVLLLQGARSVRHGRTDARRGGPGACLRLQRPESADAVPAVGGDARLVGAALAVAVAGAGTDGPAAAALGRHARGPISGRARYVPPAPSRRARHGVGLPGRDARRRAVRRRGAREQARRRAHHDQARAPHRGHGCRAAAARRCRAGQPAAAARLQFGAPCVFISPDACS